MTANCQSTISAFDFFKRFPDENSAAKYLESRRWKDGITCPHCGSKHNHRLVSRPIVHQCGDCRKQFTVRVGTIFERSHIPLDKWLYAMYLLQTSRKGISSLQLSKEVGITQKSAWFLLHRLREICGNDLQSLSGSVEVDEIYIGGSERNKHESKKKRLGRGMIGKQPVLGMRERGGKTKAKPVPNATAETINREIGSAVEPGATVYTDEYSGYSRLASAYRHKTVRHSAKEFVNGMAHTNGIESVWAVLKRGYNGVYHQMSTKHLRRYVDEFTFRLNDGNVKRHTLDRLDSLIGQAVGKRLTYADLIK